MAGPPFDLNRFRQIADRIAPLFVDRTKVMSELGHASILFSDGLCLCALCEMFEVDYLVESGTGCGGSTEMMARFFSDQPSNIRIKSVDLAADHRLIPRVLRWAGLAPTDPHLFDSNWAQLVARERLAAFVNVELFHGDGIDLLPTIVRRLVADDARVGIFIDGPKAAVQLNLAHELLAISSSVRFAALDDIGPMHEQGSRYLRFIHSPHAVFSTSDATYFHRYSWINAGRLPARMIGRPEHTGYGVGVLVNDSDDRRPS